MTKSNFKKHYKWVLENGTKAAVRAMKEELLTRSTVTEKKKIYNYNKEVTQKYRKSAKGLATRAKWSAKNLEKLRAYDNKYKADNRRKINENARAWRSIPENGALKKERDRIYRIENKEILAKRRKAYKEKNRIKIKLYRMGLKPLPDGTVVSRY